MDNENQSEDHINEHFQLSEMALQPSTTHEIEFKETTTTVMIEHRYVDEVIKRDAGSKARLDTKEIRQLLTDSRDSLVPQYKDYLDYSNAPSFSQLKSPYPLICRERYRSTRKLYDRQFQSEIHQTINQQAKAFDAVCFVRVMAITSLWPPMHSRRNVEHTHQQYFQLSPKQKKRLQYIMNVDWSKT